AVPPVTELAAAVAAAVAALVALLSCLLLLLPHAAISSVTATTRSARKLLCRSECASIGFPSSRLWVFAVDGRLRTLAWPPRPAASTEARPSAAWRLPRYGPSPAFRAARRVDHGSCAHGA